MSSEKSDNGGCGCFIILAGVIFVIGAIITVITENTLIWLIISIIIIITLIFWAIVGSDASDKTKEAERKLKVAESLKRSYEELDETIAERKKREEEMRKQFAHEIAEYKMLISQLENNIRVLRGEEDATIAETFYNNFFEETFEHCSSSIYRERLQEIRKKTRDMLQSETVIQLIPGTYITPTIERVIKLAVMAFNIESDYIINKVQHNNLQESSNKLCNAYVKIHALLLREGLSFNQEYLKLRQSELHLMYNYKLKLYQEKEEYKEERAKMREEQRVEKEIKAKLRDAEREEKRLQILERRYNLQLKYAEGAKIQELNNKISELTAQLSQVRLNKERALSMAQQTKRGYIYIISNIGSFGDSVYKIGMTRRLDPYERVIELSGASVPFPFDIHALIPSDDAPTLETALHKSLSKYRVNKINGRKEFFRAPLEVIKNALEDAGVDVNIEPVAVAKDFYLTQKIQEEQLS